MINRKEFDNRILKDIKQSYPSAIFKKPDLIFINEGLLEFNIQLTDLYNKYMNTNDYNTLINTLFMNFDNAADETSLPINLDKVFPIIQLNDFKIIKEGYHHSIDFQLDLSVLFVDENELLLHIIEKQNPVDFETIYNKAIQNLSNIEWDFAEGAGNTYLVTDIGYSASLLLLEQTHEKIENMLGKNYLLAVPNYDTIILAPDTKWHLMLLEDAIKNAPYRNVSDNIYRVTNRQLSYANVRQHLKVIK